VGVGGCRFPSLSSYPPFSRFPPLLAPPRRPVASILSRHLFYSRLNPARSAQQYRSLLCGSRYISCPLLHVQPTQLGDKVGGDQTTLGPQVLQRWRGASHMSNRVAGCADTDVDFEVGATKGAFSLRSTLRKVSQAGIT